MQYINYDQDPTITVEKNHQYSNLLGNGKAKLYDLQIHVIMVLNSVQQFEIRAFLQFLPSQTTFLNHPQLSLKLQQHPIFFVTKG